MQDSFPLLATGPAQPAPATQNTIVLKPGACRCSAAAAPPTGPTAPVYPGGDRPWACFFWQNMKYPRGRARQKLSGTVLVNAT